MAKLLKTKREKTWLLFYMKIKSVDVCLYKVWRLASQCLIPVISSKYENKHWSMKTNCKKVDGISTTQHYDIAVYIIQF